MAGAKLIQIATDGNGLQEVASANSSADSPVVGTPVSVNASGKVDATLIDNSGFEQGYLGSSAFWYPNANTTVVTTDGSAITATGTATARALATTNYYNARKRIGYNTTAIAGTLAGPREATGYVWRGNAAGLGGFRYCVRFGFNAIGAASRAHIGLAATLTAPTNVSPDTILNTIAVQKLSTGSNLQFYVKGGSPATTTTDLGVNFPATTNATDVYEFQVYCPANATSIDYKVTRLNTGNTTGWVTGVNTGLFQNTVFLGNQIWITNNATAAVNGIDIFHMSLIALS